MDPDIPKILPVRILNIHDYNWQDIPKNSEH